jgi:hypothetical protein
MEATQSFIKADHGSMKKPPKPRPLKWV